jgi:hypothetical protein
MNSNNQSNVIYNSHNYNHNNSVAGSNTAVLNGYSMISNGGVKMYSNKQSEFSSDPENPRLLDDKNGIF